MRDAQGDLAGQLTLFSNNIVVADSSLAGQLAADPNFAGRDEALLDNDGPVNPAGYIRPAASGCLPAERLFYKKRAPPPNFAASTSEGAGSAGRERTSLVEGKSVSGRVKLGGAATH